MVARNFSLQDLPYSRLLQVPDEEREYMTLEELKPHQLTELGLPQTQNLIQNQQISNDYQQQLHLADQNYIYYDLNTNQPNGQCGNANLYVNTPTIATEMTAGSLMNSNMDTSNSSTALELSSNHSTHQQLQKSASRKRKFSCSEVSDLDEDDAKSVRTTDDNKKQNHSEIEKRRRDKMNTYITELSAIVPMCHAMSRKLDKLTVLRMAVQHLKTIRGAVHSYTEGIYKPAFISDQELKMLILQAAEGFLFVVGCDRGRILYVSESVSEILNYSQEDLLGQSWFDILHPQDIAKVKEQLTSSDLSSRDRLIDAKTMLPVKTEVPQGATRLCPGTRRSFFCRMKCKNQIQIKEENESNTTGSHRRKQQQIDKKFSIIQCTGYLKAWAPAKIGLENQETDAEGECDLSMSCLVAVGRLQSNLYLDYSKKTLKSTITVKNGSNIGSTVSNSTNTNTKQANLRNVQFISRHNREGMFSFVDQRATLALGFLPQELLETSMYAYYHEADKSAVAECHKIALQSTDKVTTPVYRFNTKDNKYINIQSEFKVFKNPWTKEDDFLIAKNSVIASDIKYLDNNNSQRRNNAEAGENGNNNNYDFLNQSNGGTPMEKMIDKHINANKFGSQIVKDVEDQKRNAEPSSDSSPDPDPTLAQTLPLITESHHSSPLNIDIDQRSTGSSSAFQSSGQQRLNGTYGSSFTSYQSRSNAIVSPDNGVIPMIGATASSEQPVTSTDGNDEAAMAVIMSLLEADAGLGGPVDFSGLPWPLS
ncbi:unnamed protein product [Diamesa tonsa]